MIALRYSSAEVKAILARVQTLLSGPGLATAIQESMTTPTRLATAERFATEGDSATGQWLPLAESTKAIRRREGFGEGPINVRTGDMRAWATSGEFAVVGMGFSYAHLRYPNTNPSGLLERKVSTAQEGDPATFTPARPILAWRDSDAELLLVSLAKWIAVGS